MGNEEKAAAISRIDLGSDAVIHNLKVFAALRAMSPAERAREILGFAENESGRP
jgi:hypothetical protein